MRDAARLPSAVNWADPLQYSHVGSPNTAASSALGDVSPPKKMTEKVKSTTTKSVSGCGVSFAMPARSREEWCHSRFPPLPF